MVDDKFIQEVLTRVEALAEVDAMNIGVNPLRDYERDLIRIGALHAITAVLEMHDGS